MPTRLLLMAVFLCVSSAVYAAAPTVDPALCRAWVKHVPDADVEYQPGVDVRGKPVTSADLPASSRIKVPDQFQIPLTLNLAKALDLNVSSYPYAQLGSGTEASLGKLTIEGDRVLFNNQPLSDAQQDKLAVLCLQQK